MSLTEESKKYHDMSPEDIKWSGEKVANIEIVRPTSGDGEQCMISVPIFKDDSRDQVSKRFGFLFSVVQERLEEQNRAVIENNAKNYEKVKEKLEAQIDEYKAKNQKPTKRLLEALERVNVMLAGCQLGGAEEGLAH